MRAKTGVWLIGACGSVGAVTIAGARAIARGVAGRTGLVTELKELRELQLPRIEDLVFGGHEVSGVTLPEAARGFGRRAGVLTDRILEPIRDDLDLIQGDIRPGFPQRPVRALAGGHRGEEGAAATIRAIQTDLAEFKEKHELSDVVVINVATTEPLPSPHPEWDSLTGLREAVEDDRAEVFAPSMLYAYAALDMGLPYVNFTPSTGSSIPALDELARARGTVHAGRDGKTGETLVKTTLAPLFAHRHLKRARVGGLQHARQRGRRGPERAEDRRRQAHEQGPLPARHPRRTGGPQLGPTSTSSRASTTGRSPSTTSTSRASSARVW